MLLTSFKCNLSNSWQTEKVFLHQMTPWKLDLCTDGRLMAGSQQESLINCTKWSEKISHFERVQE